MQSKDTEKFLEKSLSIVPALRETFDFKPEKVIRQYDIGFPQVMIIKLIHISKKPPSLSRLSEKLKVSNAMITHFVDELENHGFTTRKRDTNDRRIVRVTLTAKGKKIIKDLKNYHRREIKNILTKFEAGDRKQFIKSIENIYRIVTKYEKN
ncbi:MAG: MarR family winged helix-turn-helix transcriptional regulator [Elusimicrobiota bacterium]